MSRIIVLLLLGMFFSHAHAEGVNLKFCYEDDSVYPWITGTNEGLVISEIHMIEKEVDMQFELIRLPWKRCQNEVKEGRIHAVIAASFNKDRAKWGSYPVDSKGGLNKELSLFTDSFLIYRRFDSAIRWQNHRFENLSKQSVGVQLGYSAGKDLEELGYQVTYLPTSEDLVAVLKSHSLEVIVLQNYEAQRLLTLNPDLEKIMVKEAEPVKVAEQFLLFNTSFYNTNASLVQTIWEAGAKVRKSKAFKDARAVYLKEK
ncbi:substrate-binding periplasmic protein [Undibacterium sp. Dicai25W]|uniref:substrate-binding periplasmic protein n=1 Tax=Undibacterium sp. Dicai25W TaxID=3413034 RepID=UPI003BEF8806